MRFYEINPTVIDWAAGPDAHFSYTRDTKGRVETVLGDARMSLEQELRERGGTDGQAGFDLILLDAFSSDAVPVHLLTVEAFELYRAHLRDQESAILVNISNRFLDFEPLIDGIAERFGMRATLFVDVGNPPVPTGSLWVLLADPESQLAGVVPPIQTYQAEDEAPAPTLLWNRLPQRHLPPAALEIDTEARRPDRSPRRAARNPPRVNPVATDSRGMTPDFSLR